MYVSENLQQKLFLYDPEMNQHSTEWVEKGGLPTKKSRVQNSAGKGVVITFFLLQGYGIYPYGPTWYYGKRKLLQRSFTSVEERSHS